MDRDPYIYGLRKIGRAAGFRYDGSIKKSKRLFPSSWSFLEKTPDGGFKARTSSLDAFRANYESNDNSRTQARRKNLGSYITTVGGGTLAK